MKLCALGFMLYKYMFVCLFIFFFYRYISSLHYIVRMFQAHGGGLFNYSKVNRTELKWKKIMDGIRQISVLFPSRNLQSDRERESENAKEKIKTISSCTLFFLCFSFLHCLYLTYCDLPVSFLTFSFKEQDLKLSAPLC